MLRDPLVIGNNVTLGNAVARKHNPLLVRGLDGMAAGSDFTHQERRKPFIRLGVSTSEKGQVAMQVMKAKSSATNVGQTERIVSLIGGTSLLAYGLARRDKAGYALAAIGGGLLFRGSTGHCSMYHALGLNTSERGHGKGTGSKSGVPYELGIRVDHEIRINKSPEDLYKFWRHLENLPRFMDHLQSVKETDGGISRWCAKGPAGWDVQWEAEIVNDIPAKVIGWRSLEGSDVDSGGSVRFEASDNGATTVKVSLQYNPPGGALGAWAARMFGEDPQQTIMEDLTRFKQLMETGNVKKPVSKPRPARSASTTEKWDRDAVTHASEESFPASDPPSWTSDTGAGSSKES